MNSSRRMLELGAIQESEGHQQMPVAEKLQITEISGEVMRMLRDKKSYKGSKLLSMKLLLLFSKSATSKMTTLDLFSK